MVLSTVSDATQGRLPLKIEKGSKMSDATQRDDEPAPLSELDKAMKGIVGTDKTEVDAEAQKEQRRKAKSKGKKPKDS